MALTERNGQNNPRMRMSIDPFSLFSTKPVAIAAIETSKESNPGKTKMV